MTAAESAADEIDLIVSRSEWDGTDHRKQFAKIIEKHAASQWTQLPSETGVYFWKNSCAFGICFVLIDKVGTVASVRGGAALSRLPGSDGTFGPLMTDHND